MDRRQFLRGLGVTAASASLYGALRTRPAAANSGTPQRLVLIPLLNGVFPEYFWPTDANMKLVCEPLAPWASKLTFVRGIDIEGSENHFAIRSMFTGAPVAD